MSSKFRPIAVVVISLFMLMGGPAVADLIKMSNSGLCHPPQSGWYDRTTNYQAFGSINACLNAGGKLPKGLQRSSAKGSPKQVLAKASVYSRSAFGHGWADVDGDCQDSRAEALISTSSTPVRFATGDKCRVVSGRWISPFTGNVIQNASDIDIDHVVPLAWSWDRGARKWSREKREKFANDPVNLWPVELSLNRSKGAQGPNDWLPPAGECGYVARFYRIVKIYRLEPTVRESKWIRAFLKQCGS